MILGVGIDIVELSRIERFVSRDRFWERVLTVKERDLMASMGQAVRRTEFLAGRFAAKEAASKALGTGIGKHLSFQEMEILPQASGKPELIISGEVLERLGFGSRPIVTHLSISHSKQFAVAQVIIDGL